MCVSNNNLTTDEMRRYRTRMNFLPWRRIEFKVLVLSTLSVSRMRWENLHTRAKIKNISTLHHRVHYTIGCFLFWFFDRLFIKKGIYLTSIPISFFWVVWLSLLLVFKISIYWVILIPRMSLVNNLCFSSWLMEFLWYLLEKSSKASCLFVSFF